ncbi:MAG: ion channel [Verrucomicrobiales bacterium]
MIPLLAIGLVIASAFIHYEFLWRLNLILPRIRVYPRRAGVLIAVLGAFVSHFCQIAIFACVYYTIQVYAGGDLASSARDYSFNTLLYFSTESYTSLGFGDIYPLRSLRLLVGVESIVGLVMISWTASFTFLEMNRFWNDKK